MSHLSERNVEIWIQFYLNRYLARKAYKKIIRMLVPTFQVKKVVQNESQSRFSLVCDCTYNVPRGGEFQMFSKYWIKRGRGESDKVGTQLSVGVLKLSNLSKNVVHIGCIRLCAIQMEP